MDKNSADADLLRRAGDAANRVAKRARLISRRSGSLFTIRTRRLRRATYTFSALAIDRAGNRSETVKRTVRIR